MVLICLPSLACTVTARRSAAVGEGTPVAARPTGWGGGGARGGKVKVRRIEDEGDGKYNSIRGIRELLSPRKQAAAERRALGCSRSSEAPKQGGHDGAGRKSSSK